MRFKITFILFSLSYCFIGHCQTNPLFKQISNDPVFFIDSVNVTKLELQKLEGKDIARVNVYKDSSAIKLIGEQGKFGVIYLETKMFLRNKYWNYLKSKSAEYLAIVPNPKRDNSVTYILNDKVLESDIENTLSAIDDKNFLELIIIDKKKLMADFNIPDKSFGVIIRTTLIDKND